LGWRRRHRKTSNIVHCSILDCQGWEDKAAWHNGAMYVIAIAWIYVTLLMAATETNVTAGILTFVLYGLAPLSLFLWLFGTPERRRRIAAREQAQSVADEVVDQVVPGNDRADAKQDQDDLGDRRP
jgi:hypothetical protein